MMKIILVLTMKAIEVAIAAPSTPWDGIKAKQSVMLVIRAINAGKGAKLLLAKHAEKTLAWSDCSACENADG